MMQSEHSVALERAGTGAFRLAQHVPCLRCGHDLFSSRRNSTCAECGMSVSASLQEGRLFFLSERRIRLVAIGLRCWILCIILGTATRFFLHRLSPNGGWYWVVCDALLWLFTVSSSAILLRQSYVISEDRRLRGLLVVPALLIACGSLALLVKGVYIGHVSNLNLDFVFACGLPIGFHLQIAVFSMRIPHYRSTFFNIFVASGIAVMGTLFHLIPWGTGRLASWHAIVFLLALLASCVASFLTERRVVRELHTIADFALRPK